MKRYCITLQHDSGRIAIETSARDWQSALRSVLAFERAPLGALLAIVERDCMA
jgi:hypothetical protein